MAKELCQAISAFLDCYAEFSNSLEPAEGNVVELLTTRGRDFRDAGHFLNGPNKALKSVAVGLSVEVFLRRLATLAAEIDEFGFRQFGESFNRVGGAFYVCGNRCFGRSGRLLRRFSARWEERRDSFLPK